MLGRITSALKSVKSGCSQVAELITSKTANIFTISFNSPAGLGGFILSLPAYFYKLIYIDTPAEKYVSTFALPLAAVVLFANEKVKTDFIDNRKSELNANKELLATVNNSLHQFLEQADRIKEMAIKDGNFDSNTTLKILENLKQSAKNCLLNDELESVIKQHNIGKSNVSKNIVQATTTIVETAAYYPIFVATIFIYLLLPKIFFEIADNEAFNNAGIAFSFSWGLICSLQKFANTKNSWNEINIEEAEINKIIDQLFEQLKTDESLLPEISEANASFRGLFNHWKEKQAHKNVSVENDGKTEELQPRTEFGV